MRKLTLIAVAALSMTACRQEDSLADSSTPFGMQPASAEYLSASSLPVTTVSAGAITTPTTWSGVVEIDGIVSVEGTTLTILPGTFIKAKPHADGSASGVLVVTKTGQINATGTASQPIIFTSYKLLDGDESTTAAPGEFGGVVLLGNATTNQPNTTVIEGLSDAKYQYGGSNPTHSAGTMKYVRIEFAGFDLFGPNSGNEINGLTCGGVGSGTVLDHIQVSYGKDDSFEFFGGTVNPTNLVSFAPDDDNFDFDFGFTGTLENALALADYNSTHSQSSGAPDSNGIELDNNATGALSLPYTHPTVKNLTIVGAKGLAQGSLYENGIHVRRSGKLTLDNAVVNGYTRGILLETVSTTPVNLSDLTFTNVKAHGFTLATASLASGVFAAITVPGVTSTSTSNPATDWSMTQPFFNEGSWNVSPRNTGDFQGTWTKYDFSIVE